MIEFRNITKKFSNVIANDRISCNIHEGQVHAFLGENGAGKTTLMKILSGCLRPDCGELNISGIPCHFKSPRHAHEHGIGMVHQGLSLIPSLTVTENLALGIENGRLFRKTELKSRIVDLLSSTGLVINPDEYLYDLSYGQKQMVEIFRLLFLGAKVLILDEPTTSLTPHETETIFSHLNKLKEQGHTVIFVSHKLSDVISYADTVSVLRSGRMIGTFKTCQTCERELAALMVGENEDTQKFFRGWKVGQEILRLENVSSGHDLQKRSLKKVSFSVRSGEIFGIAGVSGNGQDELVEILMGSRKRNEGVITFRDSNSLAYGSNGTRISYIPDDRLGVGTAPTLSISDNLLLKDFARTPYSNGLLIDSKRVSEEIEKRIREFNIKIDHAGKQLKTLSGGNVQRVILARELQNTPDLVVAVNPTSGLDITGIKYVHSVLAKQASEGTPIVVISENLDELMILCHRIMVLCDGASMGIFESETVSKEVLGMCMGGKSIESIMTN